MATIRKRNESSETAALYVAMNSNENETRIIGPFSTGVGAADYTFEGEGMDNSSGWWVLPLERPVINHAQESPKDNIRRLLRLMVEAGDVVFMMADDRDGVRISENEALKYHAEGQETLFEESGAHLHPEWLEFKLLLKEASQALEATLKLED